MNNNDNQNNTIDLNKDDINENQRKLIDFEFTVNPDFTIDEKTNGIKILTKAVDGEIYFGINKSFIDRDIYEAIDMFIHEFENNLNMIFVGNKEKYEEEIVEKIMNSLILVDETKKQFTFKISLLFRNKDKSTIHDILCRMRREYNEYIG